jgi:hypothetical protein
MQRAYETHLGHPEKSARAEHSIKAGHRIDFNNTSVLGKVTGYLDHTVKESIEI